MEKHRRPDFFLKWSKHFREWDESFIKHSIKPLQACLRFAFSQKDIEKVIVGVDSDEHLREIITSYQGKVPKEILKLDIDDTELLNPSNWRL